MFLTNHTNKVVKVHSAHFARGQNKEPCTGHLAASVPTKITPAAGILCFTCNPATALIFVLHASGQSMKFVFWPHPCKGSSLGNWNCVSVVFWNAGSVTLKAVKSNAARHTAHDTNPLSWRLSVKCFLPLSTKLRSKFAHKSALLSRERSFKSSADKNKKPPPPPRTLFRKILRYQMLWMELSRAWGRTDRQIRQATVYIHSTGTKRCPPAVEISVPLHKKSLWLRNPPLPPCNGCFTATRPTSHDVTSAS